MSMIYFQQAKLLLSERPRKRGSIRLACGVCLVEFSADRVGIQFRNTYVVRVLESGIYILSSGHTGRPLSQEVADVITCYSPALMIQTPKGFETQHGDVFRNFMAVDLEGRLVAMSFPVSGVKI